MKPSRHIPAAQISAGDRVRTNLDHAWLWNGTEWKDKMNKPRTGTVEFVPWYAANAGKGTIQVRWDNLSDAPNTDDKTWLMWVDSSLIVFEAEK